MRAFLRLISEQRLCYEVVLLSQNLVFVRIIRFESVRIIQILLSHNHCTHGWLFNSRYVLLIYTLNCFQGDFRLHRIDRARKRPISHIETGIRYWVVFQVCVTTLTKDGRTWLHLSVWWRSQRQSWPRSIHGINQIGYWRWYLLLINYGWVYHHVIWYKLHSISLNRGSRVLCD